MRQLALFGVRSPMAVEYEESCRRAGFDIPFAVSLVGAPRALISAVIEFDALEPRHLRIPCIVCAFSPLRRQALVGMAAGAGFGFADALIDPTAIVASSARIGKGSFVNAGSVIGAQSMFGQHVLFNRSSSAGHHTMLADFVSIGPGVTLAGNVRIGEGTVIGVGSTVLPDIRIGAKAVVAAGSVVRHHVSDGVFVAGNPAVERPFDATQSSLNLPNAE